MKSLTIILLLAVIAGIITQPSHEKFNKYLMKNGKFSGACLGGTRHESFKIFSFDYIDYCKPDGTGGAFNKKIRTDKYLGLFGTFWKL